jgi:hypothetical protein
VTGAGVAALIWLAAAPATEGTATAPPAWNRYTAAAAWSFARNGYGASGGLERALWSPRPWLHAIAGGDLTYLRFYPFEPVAGLTSDAVSATATAAGGLLLGHRRGRLQAGAAVFVGLQRFTRDDRLDRPDLQIQDRIEGSEWTTRAGWRLLLHGRVTERLWLLLGAESTFRDIQVSHVSLGIGFVP